MGALEAASRLCTCRFAELQQHQAADQRTPCRHRSRTTAVPQPCDLPAPCKGVAAARGAGSQNVQAQCHGAALGSCKHSTVATVSAMGSAARDAPRPPPHVSSSGPGRVSPVPIRAVITVSAATKHRRMSTRRRAAAKRKARGQARRAARRGMRAVTGPGRRRRHGPAAAEAAPLPAAGTLAPSSSAAPAAAS